MTPTQASYMVVAPLLLLAAGACATAVGSPVRTDAPGDALMALGRTVFTELSDPRCGACHILGDAGADGMIGPNLDELRPTPQRVMAAISDGVGIMRAQNHLTDQQIEAVAHYVARTTGRVD